MLYLWLLVTIITPITLYLYCIFPLIALNREMFSFDKKKAIKNWEFLFIIFLPITLFGYLFAPSDIETFDTLEMLELMATFFPIYFVVFLILRLLLPKQIWIRFCKIFVWILRVGFVLGIPVLSWIFFANLSMN